MTELMNAPVAGRCVRTGGFALPEPIVLAVVGAVAVGLVFRVVLDGGLPFWLDETFTGAMAAEENLRGVLGKSLLEANAPLYSIFIHLWSQLFGLSDTALRAPSLIFGIAAVFVALIPAPGIGRQTRIIWCALAAVWIPAFWYAQEARAYSILFFLCMICTVAYARLLATPDMRRATIWSTIASLSILMHYHALVLVGLQGIGYLLMHRAKALRTWPAAIAFVPVFVWIALQAPRVLAFANPADTWFPLLTWGDVPLLVHFIFGDIALAAAALLVVAIPLAAGGRFAPVAELAKKDGTSATWMAIGTAILGAGIIIALGMLRPTFTPRYLMPFMPGILLGFALGTAWLGRRWALGPIAILCIAVATAVASPFKGNRSEYKIFSFEGASQALMASGATRLVFLWDNPVARIFDSSQLDAAAGFFFRRAGRPITVAPVQLRPEDDPNPRLLAAAAEPGSAILWLYDVNVGGTAAKTYPPRIEQLDPAWQCKNFARGPFGVIACSRRNAPPG